MEQINAKRGNWLVIAGVIGVWFALVAQFYLTTQNALVPVDESVIRYFSFFTVLTNIIVAVCFTALLFKKEGSSFFTKPGTLTATAVYISVVAIIYNLILRFTWEPKGLQMVVDELLHAIVPLIFVVYWLMYVPKNTLKWRDTFSWLIYPFIYLMFILFRGSVSGFYPYPFVDVAKYGYETVFVNCVYVMLVFLGLSFLSVWIGSKAR
ncbi:Pr6Pr family membrane protein [Pedobacter foliorum]|uniref:Pr6Pr family membrane protein n=1 Tax=Pedobacter foliorum TaxID=2739058 RepID=UPI0015666A19|nr:Pr6Pr family membrane protein [Pedobacter foliorum]NRF41040.1 Pr6Pr family membrane protein [Pedobacter foliorum]